MIPDRCGNAPPHAPGNGSGEVAADRVLHVQRFTLPLGLNTPPKPHLGRRPPPAAVLTSEHHPPPALDDVGRAAAGPGSTGPCPTPGPGPARTGPGRRQARRHGPARPARAGPDRSPAQHRSRHGSSRPAQSCAHDCDRACWASLHGRPRRRSSRHHRATGLTQSRRSRFADGDSAGIPPNTIQQSVTGTTLPRPGRCCTGCIAVLHWISRALRKVMRGRR
jgi:hypothetical protein